MDGTPTFGDIRVRGTRGLVMGGCAMNSTLKLLLFIKFMISYLAFGVWGYLEKRGRLNF